MHRCNGVDNGDCDNCRNRHCEEWIECDICGEKIYDEYYYCCDDGDYHTECFEEAHRRCTP